MKKESGMKRILILACILILSLSLIACKSTENYADSNNAGNVVTQIKDNTIEGNTEEVAIEEDTTEDHSDDGVITVVEMFDDSLKQINETIAHVPDRVINISEEDKVEFKFLGFQRNTIDFVPTSIKYNELGQLIVKGTITNLTKTELAHIRIRDMSLYNENGELIASEKFGYLYYDNDIKPNLKVENTIEWTLIFPKMMVKISSDDLDYVKTVVKSTASTTFIYYNN